MQIDEAFAKEVGIDMNSYSDYYDEVEEVAQGYWWGFVRGCVCGDGSITKQVC